MTIMLWLLWYGKPNNYNWTNSALQHSLYVYLQNNVMHLWLYNLRIIRHLWGTVSFFINIKLVITKTTSSPFECAQRIMIRHTRSINASASTRAITALVVQHEGHYCISCRAERPLQVLQYSQWYRNFVTATSCTNIVPTHHRTPRFHTWWWTAQHLPESYKFSSTGFAAWR